MPATMQYGAGSTASVNTAHQVRDVVPELRILDADQMPLQYILNQIGEKKADLYKFEWPEFGGDWTEAGSYPRWTAVNTTTGTGTSIIVDNVTYVGVGDVIKDVRTGELMQVTARNTGTNTLTVVRGVGSTVATAVADNDDLVIMPGGYAEGSARAVANLAQEQFIYNYAQLFKVAASLTGTETAGKSYLGDSRAVERMKALRKIKEGMELAFLWGERNRITTDPTAPLNMTGGVLYWNTVNTKDAGGTLTDPELEDFVASVFSHTGGGPTRTFFMSSKITSVIDLLAKGVLRVAPDDQTFGLRVSQYATSHGTLNLVKHLFLDAGPNATVVGAGGDAGYSGIGFALDLSRIRARALRALHLERDVQTNGDDLWVDQYLAECGLEFANPGLHGKLYDVTG